MMPKKKKAGVKAGKKASRKPAKKKAAKKKTVSKKATIRKKSAKKKTFKKKTAKKRSSKKASSKVKAAVSSKNVTVEPGPPPGIIPPVEEPAAGEEAIGTVTHYYSHLGVAIVQINKGSLKTGDTIHVKGHTTDFSQQVESMEYEHQHVDQTSAGQSVGIKIKDHAREHDILYRVK